MQRGSESYGTGLSRIGRSAAPLTESLDRRWMFVTVAHPNFQAERAGRA